MKAARLVGPRRFELLDAPMPDLHDGQCLIKLEQVSICGSDIRSEYGRLFPEEHYPARLGTPCHECAGVVVESRCDQYREGQRVIVLPGHNSSGGLVEYMASEPSRMIALPPEGDLAGWLMCQPSGTVLFSCQQMGNVLGRTVAVVGQGAIGLSFTMLTSRMGASRVIGIDLLDYRLEWSRRMGATHTINPGQEDVTGAIEELTAGEGADVVVEAGGYPETLNMALRLVRQFGTVIVFGIQSETMVPIEHRLLMDRQPNIVPTTGARTPDPISQIRHMVELVQRGWADPAQMVTHHMSFEQVQQAYDMYEGQQDGIIKAVMRL